MDGRAWFRSSDQGQDSFDACAANPVTAAVAGTTGARMRNGDVAGIAWLSSRPEYLPPLSGWEARDALCGVACLLLGVGAEGAGRLARLARSGWFAGLEPRAEDLAASGGAPTGSWAMPVADDSWRVAAEAERFFASASLPSAWLATVAASREAGPAERSATLGLVRALRARRDPRGRQLSVVVTVEAAPSLAADAFVWQLLDASAFVVRGDAGTEAAGGHLHHFPLRATMKPRSGRLICVDLADYLYTWRPGRVSDLHVLPFARGDAELALRGLPFLTRDGGVRALNLGFHLGSSAPAGILAEIDRFATRCCELLLAPDGDAVFTDTDRMDGADGSVDLLVIHETTTMSR